MVNKSTLQLSTWICICGMLLGALSSGRWLLNGDMNIINALSTYDTSQVAQVWAFPKAVITFFSAVGNILSWNYSFLSSPWCLPIRMIGWIFSVGFVADMIQGGVYLQQSIMDWFKP